MKKGLCVIGLLIILTGCHRVPEFKDIALIDSITPTLSTAQKIGQLNQVNGRVYSRERLIEMVQQGEVGCIMNVSDAFADSLQREAITHTGIPLLFARDMIHGYHAIYPIPLGQSCSWDTALVYEAARLSAQDLQPQLVITYMDSLSTGFEWVRTDNDMPCPQVYSLSGQDMGTDMSALPAGIYIKNGKKTMKQ